MVEQELRNFLRVLVEIDLYFKVKVLKEGTKIENINDARREVINNFCENLAPQYKALPDYREIVYTTLSKLEQKDRAKEEEER